MTRCPLGGVTASSQGTIARDVEAETCLLYAACALLVCGMVFAPKRLLYTVFLAWAWKEQAVVVSVHERKYEQARKMLDKLGLVSRTPYFNVLVMKVENIGKLLETLEQWIEEGPHILTILARVVPVTQAFTFQSAEEFESKAREASLTFVLDLLGKTFHIRMYRRGFKGRLSSQNEEQFLDEVLLEALNERHQPGRITFEDPDAILALETVDCRAGLSLWTREDMQRYPFLRLD